MRGWAKAQTRCATCPPQVCGRARHGDEINPVRDLPAAGARACEAGQRHKPGARLAHRRCAGDKAACADSPAPGRRVRVLLTAGALEKPRSKAQLFKRFCAKGDAPELLPCLGKQEPGAGPHSEKTAGVRGWVQAQTRCVNCPPQARREETDRANHFAGSRRTASCIAGDEPVDADSPAPGRRVRVLLAAGALEKPKEQSSAFQAFLCVGDAPGLPPCPGKQEPGAGPHSEITAGVRGWVQAQIRCVNCPPQARVRARHGKEKDRVRVLLTAGARACEAGQRHKQGKPLCGQPTHHRLQRG